jgi:hypothetical protein
MYMQMLAAAAQQIHEERLQEAQRYRLARQVRAPSRARRMLAGAQRQISRAPRIRQELNAET